MKNTMLGQQVKNLPAIQETQEALAGSLGWDDPLEEKMATHSSILAWRIPGLAGYSPWGRKAWGMTEKLSTHTISEY